jgi:hypothetical protein
MHPRGYRVRLSARRLVLAMTGLALTLGALPALTGAMTHGRDLRAGRRRHRLAGPDAQRLGLG